MTASTLKLDHIVHLSPPGHLSNAVDYFTNTLKFNVIVGGVHADGLTENALIILSDGAYIELLAFVHPVEHYPPGSPEREKRESHMWARKSPGWIDFANLGTSTTLHEIINTRAEREGTQIRYLPERPGGRETPAGKVLQWIITSVDLETSTDPIFPFFCGDVTPREWRVPKYVNGDEKRPTDKHDNEVTGIACVRALVAEEDLTVLAHEITSVLGAAPIRISMTEVAWNFDSPKQKYILSSPQTEAEYDHYEEHGGGLYEIAFHSTIGVEGDVGFCCHEHGRVVLWPRACLAYHM